MDRNIEVKVNGSYLTKDNKNAGVQHEANVTILRIEFDESWDKFAKKVTWWNARGLNPVERTLTADLLEDLSDSPRVYLVPIPGEAMAEAGLCTFVIDGYVDGKRQRSISDHLLVKEAPFIESAAQPVDPTPTQAEQLQVQIDTLLEDMQEEAIKAETAREGVEAAREAAESAAERATTASVIAENAKVVAEESRAAAEAAKTTAEEAATKAERHENVSTTSAAEAAKSASDAAAHRAAAESVASGVYEAKAVAEASATAAKASATTAESAAKSASQNATGAKSAAETAQANAQLTHDNMKRAEAAAVAAEGSAERAADDAVADVDQRMSAYVEAAEEAKNAAERARDDAQSIAGGDFASTGYVDGKAATAESNANKYTDQKIAAIPTPDVSGQINAHNGSGSAHTDIRNVADQALSEAQSKASIFMCDVGVTSSAEIEEAYQAGNIVMCEYDGQLLHLAVPESSTKHTFYGANTDKVMRVYCENDSWGYSEAGYTPRYHADYSTSYGIGSGSVYGHVKLSAAVYEDYGSSSGIAATPSAVKQAYDLANTAKTNAATAQTAANNAASAASAAQSAADGKVSKTGDTMNGNFTIEGAFSVTRSDTGRHARTVAHNNEPKEVDFQNYASDSDYVALRLSTEERGAGDAAHLAYMKDGTFAAYTLLHTGNKEKIFTYGTDDLTAGSSSLGTGMLYFVYE